MYEHCIYRGCPDGFSGLIAHEVYKRVVDADLKQFYTEDTWKDSPRIDGEAGEDRQERKIEAQKEDIGREIMYIWLYVKD